MDFKPVFQAVYRENPVGKTLLICIQNEINDITHLYVSCLGKGERVWLHDARLQQLFWPLLRQQLPPGGLLHQPRPAHGDESVAAAAPGRPHPTLHAEANLKQAEMNSSSRLHTSYGCSKQHVPLLRVLGAWGNVCKWQEMTVKTGLLSHSDC